MFLQNLSLGTDLYPVALLLSLELWSITPNYPSVNVSNIRAPQFHLLSSTAEFTLSSPFPNTTFEITSIDAKALYPKNEVVGRIDYDRPFPIPPGVSKSPRLPVELDVGGIGYDGLKKALGGSLRLDAVASVGVRIHRFRETVVYRGRGISSNVRL